MATNAKLDPRNAVALLINAEHLKMDAVLEDCVKYCYANMEAILTSHTNLANLGDKLLSKLADQYDPAELDELRDKKDRIKSKLFRCLVEKLFDPVKCVRESPGSARTLFRCSHCSLLLTNETRRKIRCVPNQLAIDRYGELVPLHDRDDLWEATRYLQHLWQELKSWRPIYWHLWGVVNYCYCSYCKDFFRCCDLQRCRFHPDNVRQQWDNRTDMVASLETMHPCCQLRVIRFDPLEINTGCQVQDHVVSPVGKEATSVLAMLLKHRAMICATMPSLESSKPRRILSKQGSCLIRGLSKQDSLHQSQQQRISAVLKGSACVATSSTDETSSGESDESDGQPSGTQIMSLGATAIKQPTSRRMKKMLNWKWDTRRSVRYNQDAQREYEQYKFNNLQQQFLKMSTTTFQRVQPSVPPQTEFPGGIFARLEANWKTRLALAAVYPVPRKVVTANPRFRRLPMPSAAMPKSTAYRGDGS